MKFRVRDNSGKERHQEFNGECWAWLAQGEDIDIEKSTGYKDRFGVEIFEGDKVYVHYKDKSLATVKFGHYYDSRQTKDIYEPHMGFYLEDKEGNKTYIYLLNKNSEIVNHLF